MAISRKTLGERLRAARGKRYTQEQIAEAIGFSNEQISKIERGRSPVYMDKLGAWCDFIGVSVTEIVSGADSARAGERFDEMTVGCSPEFKENLLDICANIIKAAKEESKRGKEDY